MITVYTATNIGLDARRISVEVDTSIGKPGLYVTGLPSRSVAEAKQRLTNALIHSQVLIKSLRTVINLAPADFRKEGTGYDLAMAVGLLKVYGLDQTNTENTLFLGELGLDGKLRTPSGLLATVLNAAKLGFTRAIIPAHQPFSSSMFGSLEVLSIESLADYVAAVAHRRPLSKLPAPPTSSAPTSGTSTWNSILGQAEAKRACQIAAAGGHHLLMTGSPGIGKTMLAKATQELLPILTKQQQLLQTALLTLAQPISQLQETPPLRSPHHTISLSKLLGGSWPVRPGELTLAHNGILFLDELHQYSKKTLESLRVPIETQQLTVTTPLGTVQLPAGCLIIAATNPCACGNYQTNSRCSCSESTLKQYRQKISGPLRDRFDLKIELSNQLEPTPTPFDDLDTVRTSVKTARDRQLRRYRNHKILLNSQLTAETIPIFCKLAPTTQKLLRKASIQFNLSLRAQHSMLKIARTVADLDSLQTSKEDLEMIQEAHLAEAMQYRTNLEK